MPTHWTQTLSGKVIDLLEPDPAQIDINDVAVVLARIPRFNGHTRVPYSVAEHSVRVYWRAEELGATQEGCLWALLHDATEYVIGDLASPAKQLCPEYRQIEERLKRAIATRFELRPTLQDSAIVQQADAELVYVEGRSLFLNPEMLTDWNVPHYSNFSVYGTLHDPFAWPELRAREAFLTAFEAIDYQRKNR